jgi:hypothetical protein
MHQQMKINLNAMTNVNLSTIVGMRERMIEDMVGVMDGQFVNWINSAATYS